jgi:hypothetical protein
MPSAEYGRRTLVSRDKRAIPKNQFDQPVILAKQITFVSRSLRHNVKADIDRTALKRQRSSNKQNTFSSQSIVDFLVTSERLNFFQVKFNGEVVLQFSDQLNHRERVPLWYSRLGNLLNRGISWQIEELNQQMP